MPKQMLVWLLLFPLCVNPVCGLDSDLNGDGIVNAKDVIVLSKEWHQIGTPDGGEDCPWRRFGDSGIYYEGSSVGIGGPPLVDASSCVRFKGKEKCIAHKVSW